MSDFVRRSTRVVLWLSLFSTLAMAQNSSVSGRITDDSNAAVSAANVQLTRTDTGDRRQTLTSEEGYFTFPLLVPGTYELKVEKTGFKVQTQSGIKVDTGNVSTVNFQLAIGDVSQVVNVEAGVPLLQTESAAVGNVVENKTIVNMPLIDRRSAQLTRLSGFVVQNGSGSGATFAIAGGRGNNSNYMIDGGTAQNLTLGVATLSFDPPVESMQEFNVAMSNYAAELGRTGGGVIQMTTKSGTNDFHGSAYEYFRNDALNTRTFFAKSKPVLRYNLFGVSVGGPVIKNKTHFFFNYEGRRQVNQDTQTLNVPTVAETRGDFSASSTKVIDPTNNLQFPGNVIPTNRLDPVGAKLAAFYPAPNVPGAASGKANYVANVPSRTPVNVYVARVDHVFGDNDRIFGRFLSQVDHTKADSIFPTPGTDAFGRLSDNSYYNASGTWYHNISSTVINEARYTYTRRKALSISDVVGTNLTSQIGLTGVNQSFFPSITVNGYQALGATGQQQRLQEPIRSDQWADNISIIRGSHQIKLGFEYRYASNLDIYSPSAGGSFTFNNTSTNNSVASLLLGRVVSASRLETYPLLTRADSYAAFIQDNWRVTPKLTLNLGVRWDIDQPRWETQNRQNSFDRYAINPVSGTPGVITFSGKDGISKYANNWDLNNIGPRLGFAYNWNDKTVIRGGGAILFLGEYDQATPIVANTGFSLQGSFASADNGVTPAFYLANGMPASSAPQVSDLTPGYGAVPVGQKPTTAVAFFNPNRANGYLYQASVDIQRQLRGNIVVDLGYLGTFGHHLPAPDAQNINQVPTNLLGPGNMQVLRPYPQFTNVSIIAADIGNSNYHGMNIGVEKRYSDGLQFRANYTFSKFIDDISSRNELAGFPGTGAFTNYYNQRGNRGLSGNDIRHRFIVSALYEVPFGRGRAIAPKSKIVDTVAGGWTIGSIGEFRTGTPLSALMLNNQTSSFSDGVRPNVVGDPSLSSDRSKAERLAQWFNTGAFANPGLYKFGNAGRTFGSGPGAVNVDASVLKDFHLFERSQIQFRAEALNILNHANFANPDTRLGSATFGQVTSLVSGNQSRILQFGLHFKF